MIITGDSLHELRELEDSSVDFVCTDPPYGYSFMGKDWDKAVPSVEIWQECLRVLKPGAFACIMSAPRSDVQNAMISRLMQAGFRLDFTPIYWTYSSGFPKAMNIHKKSGELKGAYAGFQPKPAVEVIIVAMKPLSEKTYVDQALANGKGISWLDDGRIPTDTPQPIRQRKAGSEFGQNSDWNDHKNVDTVYDPNKGRFPANLLVSDDVLNDGVERKSPSPYKRGSTDIQRTQVMGHQAGELSTHKGDSGSYSRYFDLDKWSQTLPFLITPKASKSEKNKGLEHFEPTKTNDGRAKEIDNAFQRGSTLRNNHHPTVKPLKLMSYLITLFTRPGDIVLDPFVGSGTTCVAAKQLDRECIGIERESEYAEIARARLAHIMPQLPPEQPEPGVPPVTVEDITHEQLRLV